MSLQLTYPGVYVQELPSGTHTIAGAATSVTAFVGYLRRGPPNIPVQCLNFGDFQRAFGGLDAASVTSFQVSQFFLNGGVEAWVSRLYAASAPPVQPTVTLAGVNPPATPPAPPSGPATPSAGSNLLTLLSQNPGTWGQNIFVTVDYMTNRLNTFNLTATLYSVSSNSNSTGQTYSLVQTQSVPAVTLDKLQSNWIVEVMQSASNQYAQLLAVPAIAATPSVLVPFASGTILSFIPQTTPATGVLFSITIQPPPVNKKAATPLGPVQCSTTFKIGTSVSDLVAGIQSALSNAAGALGLPSLGSAVVRSCLSPFTPATGPAQAQLVQVWSPDPALSQYLISVTASQTVFTTLQTSYQAWQLAVSTTPATPADGLAPTGFDIAGNSTTRAGIYALDAMQIVNLLLVPDMPGMDTTIPGKTASDYLTAATATLNYAILRKAFAILDLPNNVVAPSDAVAWATSTPATFGAGIISAATYYPQVLVPTPFSTQPMQMGGSGTLAGIYALTDQNRGVWKAPAGISAALAGVQQLPYVMNDQENGQINPLGVNALRTFPIYDNIAWGSRTLASANMADDDWKYVPVRRLALYIEQSLIQGLQWVVFEPNDDRLWAQIRLTINSFLHPLYLQGAFVGTSPAQAYKVICDASTTTPQDMDNGIVNILILFAPVRPAEFVVISLQQMAGQSSS